MKQYWLILLFTVSISAYAQQLNLPMGNDYQLNETNRINEVTNTSFTSCKPLIECFTNYTFTYSPLFKPRKFVLIEKKITHDHFIHFKNDSIKIVADPIFVFTQAQDATTSERFSQNSRGFRIFGNLGKKFSFETSFIENQTFAPSYIRNFVASYKVYPGMGRTKEFKVTGFDYASSSGYVSYSPTTWLNIQYGHGKLFIGNGYRSLLLSDNAFNFPHLKVTYKYKDKLQYTCVTASLMSLQNPERLSVLAEPLFKKKLASFHVLAYRPFKRLELTLFESTIYTNNLNTFSAQAFNPIPFSNALIYGLSNTNNVLVGLNAAYKISSQLLSYGQLMVDDVSTKKNSSANRTGYQLGLYYQNVANIKHLNVRIEYNQVRPFAYQNESIYQSYSHYNQTLAHPLQANFKEFVFAGNYNIKNFIFEVRIVSSKIGGDSIGYNSGSLVLQGDGINTSYTHQTKVSLLQGQVKNLLSQEVSIGYLVNPYNNLMLKLGYFNRVYPGLQTQYVYLSASANLFNQYLDF